MRHKSKYRSKLHSKLKKCKLCHFHLLKWLMNPKENKTLVAGVRIYWKKLMTRERDSAETESRTGMTTITSELALMESTEKNVVTCSRSIREGTSSVVSITSEDCSERSTIETTKVSNHSIDSDIKTLSNSSFAPVTDVRSMAYESQKSFTTTIAEKIDQLQKRNDDQFREMNERIDHLCGGVRKSIDVKLIGIEKKIKQLTEKRIEAKNCHHELKRRFECFEHKINKSQLN